MTYSKKINQILKKCKAGYNYKETTYYFRLFTISILFIIFFFCPPILYLKLSLNTYIKFCILIIILIGIVFFIGFFYNESRKAHSIRTINLLIDNLKRGDWNWREHDFFNHIIRFHPIVISHQITMYLLGHLFLREGNTEEGDLLISKALEKDPNLNKIQLTTSLSNDDAQYLYDTIKNETRFQRVHFWRGLWTIKPIRYVVIFLFVLFILLHILAQLAKVLK